MRSWDKVHNDLKHDFFFDVANYDHYLERGQEYSADVILLLKSVISISVISVWVMIFRLCMTKHYISIDGPLVLFTRILEQRTALTICEIFPLMFFAK